MCWLCRPYNGARNDAVGLVATLSADQPQATAPRFDFTSSGHAGVDGVLSGYAWDTAGDAVSFSFPDSGADYESWYGTSEPTRGFGQVSAAMRDEVRNILVGNASGGPGFPGASVAGFTNLKLVEATDDWSADIRVAKSSAPSTSWAYYPNGREGGDVWFGNKAAYDAPLLGNYYNLVAIHEVGHALGLKHPHDSSNGFGPMPLQYDTLEYTVMSYKSHEGLSTSGGYTNGTYDYPQSWMMLDIAALQHLYGADYTTQSGNTVYSWNVTTGETLIDGIGQGAPGDGKGGAANRVFMTVWDGAGIDTYDLSNYGNGVAVDLAPGGHTVTATDQLAQLDKRAGLEVSAHGNVFNALLYDNNTSSLIENATGGAGADTLLGNDGMNHLIGGLGADRLEGRAGNDVLDGGGGADTMLGGTGDDRYLVDNVGDRVIEAQNEGTDTVVSTLASYALPNWVEVLVLGAGAIGGIGNELANKITGNALANRLEGGGGADVIEGGGGNDTLVGGSGADMFLLRRGDGLDRIEDFQTGYDHLALTGFGLTAAAILTGAVESSDGLHFDFGRGDGLLLSGLTLHQVSVSDFIC